MVKRGIILFLACLVAGCMLTACGMPKDTDTDNRDNPTSQKNVETESSTPQENRTSSADRENGTPLTLSLPRGAYPSGVQSRGGRRHIPPHP